MAKRIDVRSVFAVLVLVCMTVQAERGVGLTPEAEFVTLSDIASTPATATVTEAPVPPALNPESLPSGTIGAVETNGTSASTPAAVTANVEVVKSVPGTATNEVAAVDTTPEIVPVASFDSSSEKQNLISVALDDVPLQDVVRLFTKISGANIISSSTNLVGKVTVNLQEVEWKPALDSILDMYNLIVMEKVPGSSIFSVLPKPPGDMLISQTIFLKHSQASNVVSVIDKMIVPTGLVRPCPNVNALVVRSTVANLNEIRKVVEEIDVARQQVYIEAKFLELTDEAIKDLGINWKSLEGYEVKMAEISQTLSDNRSKFNGQRTGLGTVDSDQRVPASSKDVRVQIGNGATDGRSQVDTLKNGNSSSLSDSTEDGLVSAVGATASRDRTDSISKSLNYSHESERIDGQHLSDVRTAVLSASDFSFILSALQQLKGVSVVSNPKIIVANEQTAKIHIGENEPNITGTVTPGQQGQANSTVYKLDERKPYFNFGITLDVTPTINNDSNVLVRISPVLSRYVRDKIAPDKNTYPVESTKEVDTVFSLESGKTAAIGGLTETEEREEVSKIPLLGDIPLVGKYLFSHTHKKHTQVETIIFVTVRLANAKLIQREEGLPEDTELTQKHLEARKAKQVAITKREKTGAKPDKTP